MTSRRSFAWVASITGPTPQIIFEDPRVGCEGLTILAENPIEPDAPSSLAQLAARFPAPQDSPTPSTVQGQPPPPEAEG